VLVALAGALAVGCGADESAESSESDLTGPGKKATDARHPELGSDPSIVRKSKISLAKAIKQVASSEGPIIEGKFELDDSGKLSLSLYPLGKSIHVDAERNVFREFAGDPTKSPFQGALEVFHDQEHLTRSARDLTLIQLSRSSVADAVAAMPKTP